jgi:hypothetical protein
MCAFQLTEVGVGLLLCMYRSDSGIWFSIDSCVQSNMRVYKNLAPSRNSVTSWIFFKVLQF